MIYEEETENGEDRDEAIFQTITDFFDTQAGKITSAAVYFMGVIGFTSGAMKSFSEGSKGAGIALAIGAASCLFLSGLNARRARKMQGTLKPESEDDDSLTLD